VRPITDPVMTGLLEAAPDAMVCVDSDGRIVLVNAQAERLFGYPRDELAGQLVEILVPDAVKAGHLGLRVGYAADPQRRPMAAGLELSGRRRDGTTFPAEIALSSFDTGQGVCVSAAIRDATQSRQAARAQAWLASIIECAHDAVISVDLNGRIMTWNPGAERLWGYTAAEIIGRHSDVLLLAEQEDDVHKRHIALVQSERTEEYQAERVRKDGTVITVMVTLASIADETGRIIGLSGIVRDISAQQRADARFRGLLEAAPDAMVCVDSDGRIVLVNAQAERLFGYPRDELAGQLVEILVPDGIQAGHAGLRAGYAADPQPRQLGAGLELSGRRREGTTFPAEISLSALDTGQGILVSAAIRDASQQRQILDDLRRTNQNLQQLGYSIAHDLRTPLRSLAGFSAALIEDYADVLGEDGRNYAQRIEAASRHIGQVLDDLMHLSLLARAEMSLEPVDLGAEAAAIAIDLQREDPARSVRFTIPPQAWALADPALIREALRHLLGNAWKFTAGRDGAAIEFGMAPDADARVRCYVRDNGAGFDPAYVDKLFTPFQRLHSTAEFPGTGIGLACVREIVDRHNGRAWAEGTVGEGATFSFTLQAAPPVVTCALA
jgi:PAS domain S-box-containing protein